MNTDLLTRLGEAFAAESKSLYLVGGTLRDWYLGRPPKDIDLATDATPDKIKEIVACTNPAVLVNIGEKFGTIRVEYDVVPNERVAIEITTFRREVYQPGDRHPEVQFGTSLREDLARRDFTINAIAQEVLTGELSDPFGGFDSMRRRTIKAVGQREDRFRDDPLRLLRAVRFSCELNFLIDDETFRAMLYQAETLSTISQERIRDEFSRILCSDHAADGLALLLDRGLLRQFLPEACALVGVTQPPHHRLDVWGHTLRVVGGVPPRLPLRLAALLHDIAKPETRTEENGIAHFSRHEYLGQTTTVNALERLRYPWQTIEPVRRLVAMHMRANSYDASWSDGAVRRLFFEAGEGLEDVLALAVADSASDRDETREQAEARIGELRRRIEGIKRQAEQSPLRDPLSGDDLMAQFNRPPGPWIREMKKHLLDLVLEGTLQAQDKEAARAAAESFALQGAAVNG